MAFKDTNNTFSDIAVTSRLEKVNSFLKELDSIIDFDKLYYPKKTKQHFKSFYFIYDKIRIIK